MIDSKILKRINYYT